MLKEINFIYNQDLIQIDNINPNTTVLCIDLDLNQSFTGELIVPQDNNKLLLQIIEDFNEELKRAVDTIK